MKIAIDIKKFSQKIQIREFVKNLLIALFPLCGLHSKVKMTSEVSNPRTSQCSNATTSVLFGENVTLRSKWTPEFCSNFFPLLFSKICFFLSLKFLLLPPFYFSWKINSQFYLKIHKTPKRLVSQFGKTHTGCCCCCYGSIHQFKLNFRSMESTKKNFRTSL